MFMYVPPESRILHTWMALLALLATLLAALLYQLKIANETLYVDVICAES